MSFNVTELSVKVKVNQPVGIRDINGCLASVVDLAFVSRKDIEYHENDGFKFYCFSGLQPIRAKVYKEGEYTLLLRTVDDKLAKLFQENLAGCKNDSIEILSIESVKVLDKKKVEKIETVTPLIAKSSDGYINDVKVIEERVKINLVKKWRAFTNSDVRAENTFFMRGITKLNSMPIPIHYKKVTLLGDKVRMQLTLTKEGRDFAYFALGVGLGELNARGCGFVMTDEALKQIKAEAEAKKKANQEKMAKFKKKKGGFRNKGKKPFNRNGNRGYNGNRNNNGSGSRPSNGGGNSNYRGNSNNRGNSNFRGNNRSNNGNRNNSRGRFNNNSSR